MQESKYTIGDIVYFQRPLLVGQIIPLLDALKGLTFESLDIMEIIYTLGPRLNSVISVVLIPEGVNAKEKKLAEMTEHFDNYLDVMTAIQIVSDFFAFSPPSLILKEIHHLTNQWIAELPIMKSSENI